MKTGTRIMAAIAIAFAALTGKAFAEVDEVRISKLYGLAFLPTMIMEEQQLVQKHAKAAGLGDIKVNFVTLSTASAVNDGLLSGQLDFANNGPTALLTIWSRTQGTASEIRGVAGMVISPMWLNVNKPEIKSLRDFTSADKIVVPGIKVSIGAIILQMAAAQEWGIAEYTKLDPLTVSMSHPDGYAAFTSRRGVTGHVTSPPYMYAEAKQEGAHRLLSSEDVLGGPATFSTFITTKKFHDANPETYKAVLAAFTEAIEIINKDKAAAAELYVKLTNEKPDAVAGILEQLEDPGMIFTTTPTNIMKYADFMHSIGAIKVKLETWKDLFFPEIHHLSGS